MKNVYDKEELEMSVDSGELDAEDAGFMQGYLSYR
jgi:hypothetical protein